MEVGPEKKKFILHKEFACQYSPVFKAAFNSDFIEGQTQTYKLEDVTEAAARLLVNWFYTQQLDIEGYGASSPEKRQEDMALCQLWVLADKLLVPQLQNQTIRTMVDLRVKTNIIPTLSLEYIWANTSPGNPLRRLLVHQCATLAPSCYFNYSTRYPQEMLIELAEFHAQFRDSARLRKESGMDDNLAQYEVSED